MANPSADFPTSIHSPTDVPSLANSALGATTPTHTAVEGKQEQEVIAIQTKLGIGSTTPLAGKVLYSPTDGQSAWTLLSSLLFARVVGAGESGQDISAEINSAMVAVSAAGGGIVFISPGRYPIASGNFIVPQSNVTLMGAGVASELYKTTAAAIIKSGASGFHDFTVDNVMFTGIISNAPTVPTRNRNVSTGGSIGGPVGSCEAILIIGSLDPSGSYPVISNVILRKCILRNIPDLPILLTGITGITKVIDCEFTNNYDAGFKFNQEVIFVGNHSYGSGDNGVSLSRGNLKITCVGNTFENTCYHGIWLAGFAGNAGPQYITCTGNTIRQSGFSGITLNDGGSYAVIANNFIDKQSIRGPSDAVSDSHIYGIELDGDTNNVSNPSTFCDQIIIANNVIKGAPRAGILVRSARNVKINDNLMIDVGTQFKADGTTSISSTDAGQNIGVYFPTLGHLTNIHVFNNVIVDQRGTPYTNYAISPSAFSGLIQSGNKSIGLRNSPNVGNGSKTVTSHGTAVQLSTTTACSLLTIKALDSNTDVICIGGSTVLAATASRTGFVLNPGDVISLEINDISLIYLDSMVDGEGVTYTYESGNFPIYSSVVDGNKAVATSGTPLALKSSTTACVQLIIWANDTNTDKIAVGASDVHAAASGQKGLTLNPGDNIVLTIDDVSKVYIDARVNGEGCSFLYLA